MDAYKIILGRNPRIGASIPSLYRHVIHSNYRLRPSISDMGNCYGRILDRCYCHYGTATSNPNSGGSISNSMGIPLYIHSSHPIDHTYLEGKRLNGMNDKSPNKGVQRTRHKVSGPLTPNVGHENEYIRP